MFYDKKYSTYIAVWPSKWPLVSWNFTNLFGYTKYLNLNLNLNLNLISLMLFPINLVYSRCPIFDTKLKTSLPVIWLKHWLWKNPGRSVSTNNEQLILVGWSGRWWRCWRTPGPRTRVCLQLTMRSKEIEEYYSLILIDRSSLPYFTLAWQSNFLQIFNVITDYLPFVH